METLAELMRRWAQIILSCALLLLPSLGAKAAGLEILRDSEIEATLRDLASPIFKQAGLPPENIQLVIINDSSMNAFVAGGMNMFFHTGLLLAVDDPLELQGVMAHETGHIAGGHLIRGSQAIADASAQTILATLLGVAVAVVSGQGEAAGAIFSGGQEIARRNFLSFSRAQEGAADQAAIRFLHGAGMSARGLLEFMEKLLEQELLPTDQQVEYLRTHPLTRDRVDNLRAALAQQPEAKRNATAEDNEKLARMQAKLLGYLSPLQALRKYGPDESSIIGRYGRAMALFRRGQIDDAIRLMDSLIKAEPDNPFFYEMRGWMQFEYGRLDAARQDYTAALQRRPNDGLLQLNAANSLLASEDKANAEQALSLLQQAVTRGEERSPWLYRLQARAYGQLDQLGLARLALAKEAALQRRHADARNYAAAAKKLLPAGSPGAIQADDILSSIPDKQPTNNRN